MCVCVCVCVCVKQLGESVPRLEINEVKIDFVPSRAHAVDNNSSGTGPLLQITLGKVFPISSFQLLLPCNPIWHVNDPKI